MTQRPRTYWQKRFEILEQRSNLRSQSHISGLAKQYRAAIRETEKDLAVFYNRLAANNDLPSIAAAKKLLAADELADFKMDLETYTRLAKENGITGDWTKILENASLKHRISRLEAMKLQMEHHATLLMRQELTGLEEFTASAYEAAYYGGAFEIAKGTGIGRTLFQLDNKRINTVINRPWAADGRNFSARVWGQHRPQLVQNLHRDLTRSLMRGEGPDKAIKAITHDFDVSMSAAARLVQTEEAYFSSVAQRDVFNDLDVEQYEIIATLDSHTSDICQELDGKVFKMSEYEAGVTAPPFHVRCRTTTAPYFDDEVDATRAARDPETGQTVQVPADMKYQDWKDQYTVDPETGKTNAQLKAEQKAKEEAEAKAKAEAEKKAAEAAAAKAKAEAEARAKAEAEAARKAKEAEKPAFAPAKTIKEAEEYISQFVNGNGFGALGVSYTGVNIDVANEINKQLGFLCNEFDVKKFGGIVAPAGNTKLGKLISGATAAYSPIRNSFLLNRESMKSLKVAEQAFAKEREVLENFIHHPERYDLTKLSKRTLDILNRAKISGRATIPQTISEAITHEFGHMIERDVMKHDLWRGVEARMAEFADKISGYAGENKGEYIAESFISYMKGESVADPDLVKIFDSLKRR
jgi:SPP1 gp7 family putative phage head morphogenesis protein